MLVHTGFAQAILLVLGLGTDAAETRRKCAPTDDCWPKDNEWDKLRDSVDDRLIKTVPIGHVCHDPTYDAEACLQLKNTWNLSSTHESSSSSIMQSIWTNLSCSPFEPRTSRCEIGEYTRYVIDVREKDDVVKGIKFAKDHNIRLVIRNTGHDFLGRSTGYGSLGLWMHHVTGPELIPDYKSSGYNGPAVKVMAGDQAQDLLDYLQPRGYIAVGGDCPSVGIAGGYTQGGGHSPLSTLYGLSADQTLEFEVITAAGDKVTASPYENKDLYWALSGGGPGNYGVVWSVTLKAFKDFPVATGILSFDIGPHTEDEFWETVDIWHTIVPAINAASAFAYAYYTKGHFQIWPLLVFDGTTEQASAILAPLLEKLDSLGFQYSFTTHLYRSWNDAYKAAFPPWFVGGLQIGSRLIPRHVLENNGPELSTTIRDIFDDGAIIIEAIMAPNVTADNAVLPAWRDSVIDIVVAKAWNDTAPKSADLADQMTISKKWLPALNAVTPGSGAYLSEGDPYDEEWKENFYGAKYGRLLQVKDTWDKEGVFYGRQAVGSDRWAM